jgi:hypothetical protein
VVTDPNSLRGPSRGTVELPLRLYWSAPSPVFDLGEPYLRRWLYQIVLREASRPDDLTGYLDRDTLTAVWPQLRLPKGVRQAWEEHHPQLRAAAAGHGFALAAATRCWPTGSSPGPPRTSICSPTRSTACRRRPMRCRPRCAVRASRPSGRIRRAG